MKKYWVFKCCKMQTGSRGAVSSTIGSWWGPGKDSGIKLLKNFCLFTSGRQINSLQWKKLCKLIYFECTFNVNASKYNFMKIEFENSIRRFSFLYHLPEIKIIWINPWQGVMTPDVPFYIHFDLNSWTEGYQKNLVPWLWYSCSPSLMQ